MPQEAVLTMIIQAVIVVAVVFSCFAGSGALSLPRFLLMRMNTL